jgi:hypothetical protein
MKKIILILNYIFSLTRIAIDSIKKRTTDYILELEYIDRYKKARDEIDLIGKSTNVVNSIISQVTISEIKAIFKDLIIQETKFLLHKNNISEQIRKNNSIFIKVTSNLVEKSDIKKYYYQSIDGIDITISINQPFLPRFKIILMIIFFFILLIGLFNLFPNTTLNSKKEYYEFVFPMNYCGDNTAGGTNIWYPVYVNYTQEKLLKIKKNFCCDAEYDSIINAIQVASFYNREKASRFVDELKKKGFNTAFLGQQQLLNTLKSSKKDRSCS